MCWNSFCCFYIPFSLLCSLFCFVFLFLFILLFSGCCLRRVQSSAFDGFSIVFTRRKKTTKYLFLLLFIWFSFALILIVTLIIYNLAFSSSHSIRHAKPALQPPIFTISTIYFAVVVCFTWFFFLIHLPESYNSEWYYAYLSVMCCVRMFRTFFAFSFHFQMQK